MKNQQIEKVRKGIRASQRMLGITNKRINEGRYELTEANLRGEVAMLTALSDMIREEIEIKSEAKT
ncbi:hypothetical protein HNF50_000186 [Salmonella enterica]|nr:hypothetical protein [Salmonella enterica subsp. enterica serovar Thompson]EFO6425139.1 hypothetical protein [Salmonella enterica]